MPDDAFHTTRWTLVRNAAETTPEARQALGALCAAYYAPVVAFLHRTGREEDAARELAHEFFAHVLEQPSLGGAEPGRGRFRNYLLGILHRVITWRVCQLRLFKFRLLSAGECRLVMGRHLLRHFALQVRYRDGVLLSHMSYRPVGLLQRRNAPFERNDLLLVLLLHQLDLLLQFLRGLRTGVCERQQNQRS